MLFNGAAWQARTRATPLQRTNSRTKSVLPHLSGRVGKTTPSRNATASVCASRFRSKSSPDSALQRLDGTLIATDRLAADRPYYQGKHRCHGMNLQAVADPDGELLWISGAIRGSIHDTAAARIWQLPRLIREAGLFALADKGYQGLDHDLVITPYKGKSKPEYQKEHNRLHARLRGPGERVFAELKK